MIKETIVVEGKNDAAAVRRAVEADIIITSGFGITRETMELIEAAQARHGVIVLTDPDHVGERIRKTIGRIKGVKHAFIPVEDASREGDIGVENASPQSILKALSLARAESESRREEFSFSDMTEYGLAGCEASSAARAGLGKILGIGYANGKQFLNRLNKYGVERDELEAALERILSKTQEHIAKDERHEK